MKFLAILKDSYKEAVSGWVVPVMLVLVFIFVLFVASMSFDQVSFEEDQQAKMKLLTRLILLKKGEDIGQPEFTVDNVEQTNTETEPWKGDYTFEVVIKLRNKEYFQRFQNNTGMPNNTLVIYFWLKELSPYFDDLKLGIPTVDEGEGEPKKPDPKEKPKDKEKNKLDPKKDDGADFNNERIVRVPVTSHGTNITEKLAWQHTASIFFGAIKISLILSQREWVLQLQSALVNDVGAWFTILIGIIITAGFIPNMLRKGALDLFIAKPIGRIELLICKYIGGLMFILLMVSVTTLSVWLIIGLRFDFWSTNFLIMIPLLTFYFAILYSISTCVAVLTRNTLVAILVTIFAWGMFWVVGYGNSSYHDSVEAKEKYEKLSHRKAPVDKNDDEILDELGGVKPDPDGPKSIETTAHYMHMFMPRTYDIDRHAGRIIAKGVLTEKELKQRRMNKDLPDSLGQTIGVSAIFIVVLLALSCFVFVKRDG